MVRLPQNRGLPHALNVGFARIRGEYATWTSSDNRLRPEALETLLAALEERPVFGLAYADYELFGQAQRVVPTSGVTFHSIYLEGRSIGPCFLFRTALLKHLPSPPFDEELPGIEDTAFTLELARVTDFLHVPKVLYAYRIHSGQLTREILTGSGYAPLIAGMQRRFRERHFAGWKRLRLDFPFSPFPEGEGGGQKRMEGEGGGRKGTDHASRITTHHSLRRLRLRLLYIYRHGGLGGVESVLFNRLPALREVGIDAEMCFLLDLGGVRWLRRVGHCHVIGRLEPNVVVPRLAHILRSGEYDVVVPMSTPVAYEAIQAAGYRGPVVAECHGNVELAEESNRDNTQALVVPSQYLARAVRRAGIEVEPIVVYNGVDTDSFSPPHHLTTSPPRQRILAWCGRFGTEKNWRLFVKVAAALAERGDQGVSPDLTFWVAGGGETKPEARKFEALIEKVGAGLRPSSLPERFQWFPWLDYEEMPAFYRAVAASRGLLVHTASREALGLALIEAMACGVPVVARSVGGVPEVVEDSVTGHLWRGSQVETLQEAVESLLQDDAAYDALRQAGRERAVAKFDVRDAAQSLRDLYLSLLEDG